MGSGYDFRKAQSEGLFGRGASPFLGYFILVEDSPGSREPVSANSPHFPTDKIFHSSSYQQRMKILCERMVEQQLYSCASVLIAPNESKSGDSSHLSNQTTFRFLLSRLAGHLASETDLLGGSGTRIKDDPTMFESGSLLAGNWFTSIESAEEVISLPRMPSRDIRQILWDGEAEAAEGGAAEGDGEGGAVNPSGNPPALPEDPRSLTAPGVAPSLRNVNRSKFTKGDSNENIRSAQAYNLGMQVSCGIHPEVSEESALRASEAGAW